MKAAAHPPGAGTARNPRVARQRILRSGAVEFAARGFAGARVERIAARAGLNKRMLYHYFGDKRGLYLAVLEQCRTRPASGLDGQTARLLLWSLLEGDPAAKPDDDAGSAATMLIDLARRLLPPSDRAPRPPKPRIRLRQPRER